MTKTERRLMHRVYGLEMILRRVVNGEPGALEIARAALPENEKKVASPSPFPPDPTRDDRWQMLWELRSGAYRRGPGANG